MSAHDAKSGRSSAQFIEEYHQWIEEEKELQTEQREEAFLAIEWELD